MQEEVCPHCKAKMKEYHHTLNANLIGALIKFVQHGKPAKVSDLELSVNQHNNFQKLQYWGFIKKELDGKWHLQQLALDFFAGSPVNRGVWTYRGSVKRFDDDPVTSRQLQEEFRKGMT